MSRFLISLLLLTPLPAYCLNMLEVLQLAEQNDASYQAAQAQYQAAIETESQSVANLLPQLSFNAFTSQTSSSTTNSTSSTLPNGTSRFGSYGYSLNLNQVIYDQSLFDAAAAESARAAQALANFETARQDLLLRAAQSYFDLLAKQDAVKLAHAEQQAIAQQLEQNQEKFDAGMIAITDIKESQAQYDIAAASTIAAENALSNSQEALRLIIDRPVESISGLSERLPLITPEPDDIDSWQQKALSNNFALRARQYELQAAEKEVASRRAGHYPTINLIASSSFTSSDGSTISNAFSGRDVDDNRLTLNVDIPIYSGGATSSTVRQYLAQRNAAKALYKQQQRITTQQVRSAFLNIKANIAQVKALRQALVSTQSATEATQAGFDVGRRNSVDVLLAQRTQFASENDYARSRYEFVLNVLKLKQAAGILTADDLLQINQFIED